MTPLDDNDPVAAVVRQVLSHKLAAAGHPSNELAPSAKLLELGLIDSEDLIEVILEVEERCQCEFDPTDVDMESGLTLAGFVRSFVVKR